MELLKLLLGNSLYTKITILISLIIFMIVVIIIILMSKLSKTNKIKNENNGIGIQEVKNDVISKDVKIQETQPKNGVKENNNVKNETKNEIQQTQQTQQIQQTKEIQQTQETKINTDNSSQMLNKVNETIDKHIKNIESLLKNSNIYKYILNNKDSSDGSSDSSNTKIHILTLCTYDGSNIDNYKNTVQSFVNYIDIDYVNTYSTIIKNVLKDNDYEKYINNKFTKTDGNILYTTIIINDDNDKNKNAYQNLILDIRKQFKSLIIQDNKNKKVYIIQGNDVNSTITSISSDKSYVKKSNDSVDVYDLYELN